jgi:hypothetical protein
MIGDAYRALRRKPAGDSTHGHQTACINFVGMEFCLSFAIRLPNVAKVGYAHL